jgi:hypothetical protein
MTRKVVPSGMSKKLSLALSFLVASPIFAWLAACLDVSPVSSPNSGPDSSVGDGPANSSDGRSGGDSARDSASSSDRTSSSDGGVVDADATAEAGGLGLLVDNMTAMKGTQISLQVPPGETPGSYYAYSDYPTSNDLGMMSIVSGTSQLLDVALSSPVQQMDGSQIVGELCFGGNVVGYAGLGMSLAYGNPPDASPESGLSSPVPFDASQYSGVSFYILVDPSDGPAPSIHFGVPDTQTADPVAWPTTACAASSSGDASDANDGSDAALDAGSASNPCDDDFGSDLTVTPGTWTKVAFKWAEMQQQSWGAMFPGGIKLDQLIGMKWQANGPTVAGVGGGDAAAESFRFCISDIYFTP